MTRQLGAGVLAVVLCVAFGGCSGLGNSVGESQDRHSQAFQPANPNPNPPPPGSSYTNTQCSASDTSCAGPWSSSTAQYDDWETASPNGSGTFQQRVICDSTASCAAMGQSGIDEDVAFTWVPNNGVAVTLTTDYQPACDPNFNDAYPSGCAPFSVAFQAKNASPGAACLGSPLTIGFPPAGADNSGDDIVQIYAVRGLGLGANVGTVGAYVYQTGSGSYWFQLNATVSGGVGAIGASAATPYFSIGGITPTQLVAAMNEATTIMNMTTPPMQISKILAAGLKFTALPCFQIPWNGTYTAGFKRRV